MKIQINPKAKKEIWKLLARNLTAGVDHYTETVREKISIQGVPDDRRSYPGEPPRKETGDLYEGFHAVIDTANLEAVTGSDQPYALDLELGLTVLPRPFIINTLLEEADEMAARMTKP